MALSAKNIIGSCLLVCLAVLSVPTAAIADTLRPQTEKMLQPQGLDYTGVYALRQIDPNLTGAGVKFAVIARSITHIDG